MIRNVFATPARPSTGPSRIRVGIEAGQNFVIPIGGRHLHEIVNRRCVVAGHGVIPENSADRQLAGNPSIVIDCEFVSDRQAVQLRKRLADDALSGFFVNQAVHDLPDPGFEIIADVAAVGGIDDHGDLSRRRFTGFSDRSGNRVAVLCILIQCFQTLRFAADDGCLLRFLQGVGLPECQQLLISHRAVFHGTGRFRRIHFE